MTGETVLKSGSKDAALRTVLRNAALEDVSVVVIIRDDGQVTTWADVCSDEDVQWAEECLEVARDTISLRVD